ncbi:MAG: sulfur carrier protein ThiS [Gammaproteobacteria bacterium]
MEILLNGVDRELAQGATIAELVSELELVGRRVAVEVNGRIVPASKHGEYPLGDGDRVELISAIGGG